MKKLLSHFLIVALLLATVIPVSAADTPTQKEEVIYGILNLDGSANHLYAVNIFKGGAITDYGNYSDLRNMTTSEKLNKNGDEITINTKAEKFYYQGTLANKELPWDISIKYYLDDKEISGDELAGKSGKLKITASVKQNNEINNAFFNNYALQIAISLDNKLCTNIIADNATVAEAGGKKQLAYTVLPGSGIDITVTADVHDFEMDAISINGIRLALGIEVDSDEFTGELTQLADAIKGLDNGAGELLSGLGDLSSGIQRYIDGMRAFKDGISQLSQGAAQLKTGAVQLSAGLSELTKQNAAIIGGAMAMQQAAFDGVNAQLASMKLGLPVLTPENYSTVLSDLPQMAEIKKQLDGAVQFAQGVKGYMEGVAELGKGASELAGGIAEFSSSTSIIAASANELYNAGVELNSGIKKLRDGLAAYKEGTKKLRNGTSGMDSEIDAKIEEMIGSVSGKGDPVISFVSDKNTNVTAVQFVMKTAAVEIPEEQKAPVVKAEKLGFWQRLLKLFGF